MSLSKELENLGLVGEELDKLAVACQAARHNGTSTSLVFVSEDDRGERVTMVFKNGLWIDSPAEMGETAGRTAEQATMFAAGMLLRATQT